MIGIKRNRKFDSQNLRQHKIQVPWVKEGQKIYKKCRIREEDGENRGEFSAKIVAKKNLIEEKQGEQQRCSTKK